MHTLTPAQQQRFKLETLREAVLVFKQAIERDLNATFLVNITKAQLRYQIEICNAEYQSLTDQLRELDIDQAYTVPMQAQPVEPAPEAKPKRRRKAAGMEGLT
jgi:hypothetical protein